MNKFKGKINFDPSIKLRSFKIILKRENFDAYRAQHSRKHYNNHERSDIFLPSSSISTSTCMIILSSSETEKTMQKLRERVRIEQCNDDTNGGKAIKRD